MQNNVVQSWVNGQLSNSVDLADRGLAYGHGVFETLRVCGGLIPLLPWHRERLALGCNKLGIPIDTARLQQFLGIALSQNGLSDSLVKIIVTSGVGERGYKARQNQPNYIIQLFPAVPLDKLKMRHGIKLHLCNYRLPENPALAGIKHLNRLDQVLAAAEFDSGDFADGLMLDCYNKPIETLSRNIFFKTTDGWVTPLLDNCGVAGVIRHYLLEQLLPGLGVRLLEQPVTLEQLLASEEIFVCNSVTGIWPVIELAGLKQWSVGTQTQSIICRLGEQLPCFLA